MTFIEECEYEVIRNIHDTLNDIIDEAKDSPEPPVITKPEMKGYNEEKLQDFWKWFSQIPQNAPRWRSCA